MNPLNGSKYGRYIHLELFSSAQRIHLGVGNGTTQSVAVFGEYISIPLGIGYWMLDTMIT